MRTVGVSLVDFRAGRRKQCPSNPYSRAQERRRSYALTRPVRKGCLGNNGDLTSVSASGAQSARTTAATGMLGTISATIKRAHALITGARMASLVSVTITSD